MNRTFLIFIVMSLMTSCFRDKSTFDQSGKIEKLGTPIKVEYFRHVQGKAFQYSDTATFVVTEQHELKSIIDEIKNADNPEPWKGAGWDRIKIYFSDTILNVNTNNKKIGTSSSGTFYDLDCENFITRRIKEK